MKANTRIQKTMNAATNYNLNCNHSARTLVAHEALIESKSELVKYCLNGNSLLKALMITIP